MALSNNGINSSLPFTLMMEVAALKARALKKLTTHSPTTTHWYICTNIQLYQRVNKIRILEPEGLLKIL